MSIVPGIGGTLSGVASNNPLGGIVSGIGDGVADLGLDAVSSWVLHGTEAALNSVAQLIGQATAPQLDSSWFSGTYWRVAGLASLLTLPFLFAAAVQALLRGDLMLLVRAAFMYLPMALLGVALAAPVVMLLLSATDQMCSIVSGSGASGGAQLLDQAAAAAAATSALDGSPFFAFVVGLIALAAALALTLELMIRAAAVYVVVLMLPLAFAALVWPARRVWAIRVVELLTSLILSKFVIVAVLSLAGAAFGQADGSSTLLTAMTLLLLSTFAPWALMRLLPFTEVAAAATGSLRAELPHGVGQLATAAALAEGGMELARMLPRSRSDADSGWEPAAGDDWQPMSGATDEMNVGDDEEVPDGDGGPRAEAMDGGQGGGGEEGGGEEGSGEEGGGEGAPNVARGGDSDRTAPSATGGGAGDRPGPSAGMENLGGGGDDGTANPGAGAASGDAPQGERLPGFDPMWQAENQTWTPMSLGPGNWSKPGVYSPTPANDAEPGGAELGGPAPDDELPVEDPSLLEVDTGMDVDPRVASDGLVHEGQTPDVAATEPEEER